MKKTIEVLGKVAETLLAITVTFLITIMAVFVIGLVYSVAGLSLLTYVAIAVMGACTVACLVVQLIQIWFLDYTI